MNILNAVFLFTCGVTVIDAKVIHGNEAPGSICEIENGVKGRCELMTSCLKEGGVARHNETLKMCSKSEDQEYVCCRRPFEIAKQICNSWKSYWRDNDGKCVVNTLTIVGGKESRVGGFPEVAILGVGKNARRVRWICGGTLISPYFVLTAAHCVLDPVQMVVRLGDHDITQTENENLTRLIGPVPPGIFGEDNLHFEERNRAPVEQFELAHEIIIHPEYDRRYNDIALIQLQKPMILTERVLPACLPTNPNEDYNDYNLTVAGWGRVQFESYKLSSVLQEVTIPVIERTKCWRDLEKLNSRLIPKGITQEQLCAGSPGKDSCKGDSGGPLVLQELDKTSSVQCEHTIAGIVSFGSGCGRFGVYTRVSSYVDWITRIIAPGVAPKLPIVQNPSPLPTDGAVPNKPIVQNPSPHLTGGAMIFFPN